MRGRRPLGLIAVAVLIALIVFGVLAWRAGGPRPIEDVVLPVAVPGQAK
ncbi:hypothetical protein WSK_1004 [Novosphingobium sp. Rr 2-17]|nr:hypothetical protein WSK_1004 [Novosphingobium sp. Rr 2-17]